MRAWLFRRFLLRRLREHWLAFMLLMVAVGLSIAVFMAVLAASEASVNTFTRSTDMLAGPKGAFIRSRSGQIEAQRLALIYPFLKQDFDCLAALDVKAMVSASAQKRESINILGVDFTELDAQALKTNKSKGEKTASLVMYLSEELAKSLEVQEGATLQVFFQNELQKSVAVTVAVFLDKEGSAAALLDIESLQRLSGTPGGLSFIRLTPRLGESEQAFEARLSLLSEELSRLSTSIGAPELFVESSRQRREKAQKLLGAFQFNISAMVLMTLLVAAMAVFQASQLSTLDIAAELSLLRTLGCSRAVLWVVLMAQSVLLGGFSAILGLICGRPIADAVSWYFMNTVLQVYGGVQGAGSSVAAGFELSEIVLTIVASIFACVIGAAYPFWKACNVPPRVSVRKSDEAPKGSVGQSVCLFFLALVLCAALIQGALVCSNATLAHAAAFVLVLSLLLASVPSLAITISLIASAVRRFFGAVGLVTLNQVSGMQKLRAFSLGTSAAGLCLLVGLGVMISSFRYSLTDWLEYSLPAQVYIRAEGSKSSLQRYVPSSLIAALRQMSEVSELSLYSSVELPFRGETLTFGGIVPQVAFAHKAFRLVDGSVPANDILTAHTAMISESAARRYNIKVHDQIMLMNKPFSVAAIYKDYTNEHGTALVDLETFRENTRVSEVQSVGIYLAAKDQGASIRDRITELVRGQNVSVQLVSDLKSTILVIFDQTFAVTEVVRWIILGMCALVGAVSQLQFAWDRRRELKTLYVLGFTSRQLQGSLLLDAFTMGIAACPLGCLAGVLLSYILIAVINPISFGWTLQWYVAVADFAWPVFLVLVTSMLFAVFPLLLQKRIVLGSTVSDE